jgi:cysteine-rich repeat protein
MQYLTRLVPLSFLLLTVAATSSAAFAQPVPVTVIAEADKSPAGTSQLIKNVRNPMTNSLGQVSFIGELGTNEEFVFVKTSVVFESSSVTSATLSGGDFDSSGVSDSGGWAYIPSVDGKRAIWTDKGQFIRIGDAAPNYPGGGTIQNLYRVSMLPNGTLYWIANITPTSGSTKRALYVNTTGNVADSQVVLTNGDDVGIQIDSTSNDIDYDYEVADNGSHYIIVVDVATGNSSTDTALVVDGAIVAREDQPNGSGDDWDNFRHVYINDSGNYVFSGDSDGSLSSDGFLAYNGAIILREGDTVAGVNLVSFAEVLATSINNDNRLVHIWTHNNQETLFATCDPTNVAATTRVLLAEGDLVDIDGDGTGDATVTNFQAVSQGGNGLHLAGNGAVYVEVLLDYGSGNREAILRLDYICCGNGVTETGETCDDGGESATCNADCTANACGDNKINMTAGEECDEGGAESASCDDDCTLPVCGDGNTNEAAGEICDDSGESATCNADCTAQACGDSKVNATAGEDCDPGAETVSCDSDCTWASCGDGVVNTSAGEACDTAGSSASCDSDCTAPMCGDSILNTAANEQCEDGNDTDGDGCSSTCTLEGGGDDADAGPGADAMIPIGPDAGGGSGAGGGDEGCCAAAGRDPAEHGGAGLLVLMCAALLGRRRSVK